MNTPTTKPTTGRIVDVLMMTLGTILSLVVVAILIGTNIPLGLPGEWVWNRSPAPPSYWASWFFPVLTSVAYLILFVIGDRLIDRCWPFARMGLLVILCGAAALWQRSALDLPHPPLGMERWAPALFFESTSGYFAEARKIEHPTDFVRGYKEWVSKADSFHQGTHPPGLILLYRGLLTWMERDSSLASSIDAWSPPRLRDGLEAIGQPLTLAERATLLAASIITWTLSLATTLLIYAFVRFSYSPRAAWWGASLWPILPSGLLFLPLADVLFAFLSLFFWLLVFASFRWRIGLLAVLAGGVVSLGLMLSLAFVVVAAIAGFFLILEAIATHRYRRAILTLIFIGAGIALPIESIYENFKLSMFDVWQINLEKHAGFYAAMPRSYFPWLGINLLELAAMTSPALMILAFVWSGRTLAALRGGRNLFASTTTSVGRWTAAWLLIVLLLDLSGRNRSESARLWLFLTPMIPIAVASWSGENDALAPLWARVLLTFVAMVGTLVLLGWVEPLLPVMLSP
jgi:hypothetical protein